MATPETHTVDVHLYVPNRTIGDDNIITALEAIGCYVIGLRRDEPINSHFIQVLPIRPAVMPAPS